MAAFAPGHRGRLDRFAVVTDVWPGRPTPLGATWDGTGTNVAVFSAAADSVELVLPGPGGESRLPLRERTGHVWHGYVPGLSPGDRYGLRAYGPWDPGRGLRFDAAKLLTDPYARTLAGGLNWDAAAFAHGVDTAGRVPWSVVTDTAFPWGEEIRPRHALADSVIYELHVRGFTAALEDVPGPLRGTYAGLAHPAALAHLQRLGVTAVELLPVHHFVDEPHLQTAGLRNYWGYNSLGWFAPHAPYAAGPDPVREFKAMVRALHAAGLEVLLDVVYNHTAEGDEDGPTLCWRGLDNASYYRLAADRGLYDDVTGCGNTPDLRQPPMLATVLDSLRYWVNDMHVDGFRFDLAPALARTEKGFDLQSAFLAAAGADPALAGVTLIAEPWDIGPGGYQVGQFPAPWSEWNGRYRDAVRDVWRGAPVGVADLAYRLTGSSDLYQPGGRGPVASVGFVTAHDGFTLADLVSYDVKHNGANGEQGRDGTEDNRSWNGGAEGPTDDPAVLADRRTRRRSLLATLLLSTGVPMLLAGDELGRTQGGNNNAYCQDNATSWLDWSGAGDPVGADPALTDLVAALVHLRREHPVLRQSAFFAGAPIAGTDRKDVGWFDLGGAEMSRWSSSTETLGMFLSGDGLRTRGPRGEALRDGSYLVWLNPQPRAVTATLPSWAASYTRVLDTSADDPLEPVPVTGTVALDAWAVVLLSAELP
jgi:isoamylase